MMELQSNFLVSATLVANEFIDQYMAAANGEYVKVYLYILRHQEEPVELGNIADALNHTEADVRRALSYWEKLGVLTTGTGRKRPDEPVSQAPPAAIREPAATAEQQTVLPAAEKPKRKIYSPDQVNKLVGSEDFSQLLYIVQKYLNKVFTQRECEVFAYLYDGLKMSIEILEYLVEYCVQNGHTSIRYIETVALNWHELGLDTVEAAKAYSSGYAKNSFAVMKAFGLSDRRLGDVEKDMVARWFTVYGFTKELVVEACNRTMMTINKPSFQYAEKILSDWNRAGVKSLKDVEQLDQKRTKTDRVYTKRKTESTTNRFHNFEQRDTNYGSLVLEQVKSWMEE